MHTKWWLVHLTYAKCIAQNIHERLSHSPSHCVAVGVRVCVHVSCNACCVIGKKDTPVGNVIISPNCTLNYLHTLNCYEIESPKITMFLIIISNVMCNMTNQMKKYLAHLFAYSRSPNVAPYRTKSSICLFKTRAFRLKSHSFSLSIRNGFKPVIVSSFWLK